MTGLPLTYAGMLYYDRTLGLLTGDVEPKGINLSYEVFEWPGDLFRVQCQTGKFELSEMSMSSYLVMLGRGDQRFVGLPLFISRNFRHSQIYVNAHAGISKPADLIGRRVGISQYQMTAALWIRGFLQHDYGVLPTDLKWFTGGLFRPGYQPRYEFELSLPVEIEIIPESTTLEAMLAEGDLDALITVQPPTRFIEGTGEIDRLFPDYREVERGYYARTGIFPIMHLVVVRRDVYEQNPWVTESLVEAFAEARQRGLRRMRTVTVLAVGIPWLQHELEEADRLFGGDPFRYGVGQNEKVLTTMTQYAEEQGLTPRRVGIDEMFAAECTASAGDTDGPPVQLAGSK